MSGFPWKKSDKKLSIKTKIQRLTKRWFNLEQKPEEVEDRKEEEVSESSFSGQNDLEGQCVGLISLVKKELLPNEQSSNLESRYKEVWKIPLDDRIYQLPALFLLFEKSSAHLRGLKPKDLRSFRKSTLSHFPAFSDRLDFQILHLNFSNQESLLATYFLRSILLQALEHSNFNDSIYLRRELDHLEQSLRSMEDFERHFKLDYKRLFSQKSRSYFNRLVSQIGEKIATNIYQENYELILDRYRLLESFYFIASLIPEKILNEHQLAILTKSQISHLMLDQLKRLEVVNKSLEREIEEKNRAEKVIKDSEHKLFSLIEQSMDPIIQMDAMGSVVYWNGSAKELFLWDTDQVIGKMIDELIIPIENGAHFMNDFYRFVAGGKSSRDYYRVETPVNKSTGEVLVVEWSISKVNTAKGPLINAILRDVSERVLREKYLHEAKLAAEKASEAKAKFLSTMSHEIRTPLNAILGATSLLLDSKLDNDQEDNLEILKFSTENLLVIVNDILDFSKIEEGKLSFESRLFSLKELVSNSVLSLQGLAKSKGIRLRMDWDSAIPQKVIGDATRTSQVLINLVNNAIKFTEEGEVNVRISLLNLSSTQCLLKFDVQDTGEGIPEDKKQYIFEMFTQVESSTTRQHGGTGLGLAICRRIVEQQGGSITVKSEIGVGSNFTFTLPFLVEHDGKDSDLIKPQVMDKDLNGMKILLVEDYPINQMIAMKFLKKWNCEVTVAENGQVAVDKVKEDDFDLILMDIQMPVMDGFESTKEIRKLGGRYQEIPIFALTASVMIESKQKVFEAGMDDFITKPFKTEEFYQKLEQHKK